jgi:hypothetical protein
LNRPRRSKARGLPATPRILCWHSKRGSAEAAALTHVIPTAVRGDTDSVGFEVDDLDLQHGLHVCWANRSAVNETFGTAEGLQMSSTMAMVPYCPNPATLINGVSPLFCTRRVRMGASAVA